MLDLRRRDFVTLLGGAAAGWPLAARAQHTAMPVIGFLDPRSPQTLVDRVRGFRQGLKDAGYVEGENVAIEYRWAEAQFDRLPALAAELVRRQVVVIVAANTPSALAAKAVTTTIPIVFNVAEDPVRLGLVASLARPGGNLTGINFLGGELTAKRLELLRELVPGAVRIAVLVNPANTTNVETTLRDAEPAALAMGLQIHVLKASTSHEINWRSRRLCASGQTPCSLAMTPFSPAGVCNWSIWRRAMQSQLHILHASLPKPAA
jgi:putative ABC transport system substrate-binding protein